MKTKFVAYFTELSKCDYYDAYLKNYTNYIELSSLTNFHSDDESMRFSVYIIGERNAHISLSVEAFPDIEKDFAYEICEFISMNLRLTLGVW